MPRTPRSELKSSYYHIMLQGINKSYIFDKSEDIKYYIKLMYELLLEYNLKIIAYCVMNNHVHILIQVKEIKELSKYMQRLNMKYSRYYNKKYNRVGYVFRNRFKSEPIVNEKHLNSCIKYIWHNPVKAGICKTPLEYPYSNYNQALKEEINIDYGSVSDKYIFLDTEEDIEMNKLDAISSFLIDNNIDNEEIKNNRKKLKEIITILRENYKMSFERIAEKLGINKERVRRLYYK